MKIPAERIYWSAVGFVVLIAATFLANLAWQNFVGRIDGKAWDLLFETASWLFPLALAPGVVIAELTIPQLHSSGIDAVFLLHALLTLGMVVWFYRSRRAPLRLRVAVLAGLMFIGVAARLLVFWLIAAWIYS